MNSAIDTPVPGRRAQWLRWVACTVVCLLCGYVAYVLHVPAGWMVGPMVAAVVFALSMKHAMRVSNVVFVCAQSVIGDVIACTFLPSDLGVMVANWWAVLLVGGGTLVISLVIGDLLARMAPVDKPTAVLGAMPGGASGMVAMSPAMSADPKLVAVMQYVRLIMVVLSAALLTHFLSTGGHGGTSLPSAASAPWWHVVLTIVVGAIGTWLGRRIKLPAGAILGSLLAGMILASTGVHLALPTLVSAPAYVVMGMYVGLLFDRASLKHAGLLLPYIIGSTVVLILACLGISVLLEVLTGNNLLTCLLATSPGGLDSVALLAIGGNTNMALILSLQTVRLLTIVLLGPFAVRYFVARGQRG